MQTFIQVRIIKEAIQFEQQVSQFREVLKAGQPLTISWKQTQQEQLQYTVMEIMNTRQENLYLAMQKLENIQIKEQYQALQSDIIISRIKIAIELNDRPLVLNAFRIGLNDQKHNMYVTQIEELLQVYVKNNVQTLDIQEIEQLIVIIRDAILAKENLNLTMILQQLENEVFKRKPKANNQMSHIQNLVQKYLNDEPQHYNNQKQYQHMDQIRAIQQQIKRIPDGIEQLKQPQMVVTLIDEALELLKLEKLINYNDEVLLEESKLIDLKGECFKYVKRYNEAIQCFNEAIHIKSECFGDDHKQTLMTKISLATTYFQMGQFQKTLDIFQNVLTLQQRLNCQPDVIGSTYNNIAAVLLSMNQSTQALEASSNALSLMKQRLTDDNDLVIKALRLNQKIIMSRKTQNIQ